MKPGSVELPPGPRPVPRLVSRSVRGPHDVRDFFDRVAADYRDSHGPSERLLRYRLSLLDDLLPRPRGGLLVEVGCGTAMHLFALAGQFDRSIGLDLSPSMIERSEALRLPHPHRERIGFAVDPAEDLQSLADDTADVVMAVGVFEHLLDQPRAAKQIFRVLKPGGRFVCLTPNGGYLWYRRLAPFLGLETKHLSTDRFLTEAEWRELLASAGFTRVLVRPWTFIPRGDMPSPVFPILAILDRIGRLLRRKALRGGLAIGASKDP